MNKPVWENYSTDQKIFAGHMFNIRLEEKLYKMSFKALPVKIQRSKNRQWVTQCAPPPGVDRVKASVTRNQIGQVPFIAVKPMIYLKVCLVITIRK